MAKLQPLAVKLTSNINTSHSKADGSPVTNTDKAIEKFIRNDIMIEFPDYGIIGEEFPPHQPDSSYQWIIDPIDGTRAMISGFPTFTTLLALLDNGVPIFSSILQPITGELWLSDGSKTLYTSKPINCTKINTISEATFSTTSPLLFRDEDKPTIEAIMSQAKICQFGGDAYAYGKLACGNINLIIESGMQAYDFLPLVPIVQGAGGIITDWQGKPLSLKSNGDVIAASSDSLHEQAMALLNAA